MAKSIVLSKKQKKKETIIFVILCILIVILLLGNIWALVYILNGGTKHGSPSFISTDKHIIGHVLDNQKATNDIITLDDEVLNPGSASSRSLQIENYGRNEFYLRMYCEFQVTIDEKNFETKDFIDFVIDSADGNWIKSSTDNKYYSTVSLQARTNMNFDCKFILKPELGQDDLYDEYRTCKYKLYLHIETLNSAGVVIDKTSEGIANSWK